MKRFYNCKNKKKQHSATNTPNSKTSNGDNPKNRHRRTRRKPNSLIGKFPSRLGRCSIPLISWIHCFRAFGTESNAFAVRLGMGLTWGRISSVGGAKRRRSGRGVMAVSFTLLVMMVNLGVEPRTRGGAEFETTFHSGCLFLILCGVVKEGLELNGTKKKKAEVI